MYVAGAEKARALASVRKDPDWHRWGPYLSDRQWGTIREDYSTEGDLWGYISHDDARSFAYRWGEDGIGGIADRRAELCFSFAFWNGRDPFLKERLFGLTNPQGNHGEDVKEYYYYLDSTPTHSYMKMLYKYPQNKYPYEELLKVNRELGLMDPEYELIDTKIFNKDEYFDIEIEYAKADPEDILIRLTVRNRAATAAELTVLPQVWFRNRWDYQSLSSKFRKPSLRKDGEVAIKTNHNGTDNRWLFFEGGDEFLFTENDTNTERLNGKPNASKFVRDAFHKYVVDGDKVAVNPKQLGTKGARVYRLKVPAKGTQVIRLRWTPQNDEKCFLDFDDVFATRRVEADDFYSKITPGLGPEDAMIQRQCLAGMLWCKQYYGYNIRQWLTGDPALPNPDKSRWQFPNARWLNLQAHDILSMPDAWEYPWFAAWDLAFHTVPFAMIDPAFAKDQLITLLNDEYMHPNGQLPAYENEFSDVNPPVHAWGVLSVYTMEKEATGKPDVVFLKRAFAKLLVNFTWWVNQKDIDGNNCFEGGFLGLDNISVFNRSLELPDNMKLEQSDATGWMAMYSLVMMNIALELSKYDAVYAHMAHKFLEHFVYIGHAMNKVSTEGGFWDEAEGFYFDVVRRDHTNIMLHVYSLVGLIPLFAVTTIEPEVLDRLPEFRKKVFYYHEEYPELFDKIEFPASEGGGTRVLLSLVPTDRLGKLLDRLLDEDHFLSDYGIRSLSKFHKTNPLTVTIGEHEFGISYEPGLGETKMFGGNSNWRGPIWFPTSYLIMESLSKLYMYYGDSLKVPCPTKTGPKMTLNQVAMELGRRMVALFKTDATGKRPVYGADAKFQTDPNFKDHILFYEYFHGDTGAGLGASHQTGWTGLTAWIQHLVHTESE